jgi:ribosomal protein L11 methyltransferase
MTSLYTVSLQLDQSLSTSQLASFELVFSELLDAAATAHLRDDGGDWIIEAIFTSDPDKAAIDGLLALCFAACGHRLVPVSVRELADRDWLAENRAAFPPRRIGRFWIFGGHVETPPPAASWPVRVEAAQAFGSGTHPTTEGCLRALEDILRGGALRRPRCLDMGCGSAILALAALRARPGAMMLATDNDPIAVRTAAENGRINHITSHRLRSVCAQGYRSRQVRGAAPFDIILANILARPLCQMAGDQRASLSDHGWLILSGILNNQAVMVERRYAAQGVRLARRIRIGEWTTLVMRPARLGLSHKLWHPVTSSISSVGSI